MPASMFLVFVATILAGSLAAVHYTIVHIILKRPFGDEIEHLKKRDPSARATADHPRHRERARREGLDG